MKRVQTLLSAVALSVIFGAASAQAQTQIIDNNGSGFNASGNWWANYPGQGFNDTVHFTHPDDGEGSATWTASGLAPGMYRVSATWSPHENRATDAPYTVFDDSTVLGTARVNQERAPDDMSDGGEMWEHIGAYKITSGTLVVALSNAADEYVIADAVRIEQLTPIEGLEGFVQFYPAELCDAPAGVTFGPTTGYEIQVHFPFAGALVYQSIGISRIDPSGQSGHAVHPPGLPTCSGERAPYEARLTRIADRDYRIGFPTQLLFEAYGSADGTIAVLWPGATIYNPAMQYVSGQWYIEPSYGPVTVMFHASPTEIGTLSTYAPQATRGYFVDTLQEVWMNVGGEQYTTPAYAFHNLPYQPYINGLTSR